MQHDIFPSIEAMLAPTVLSPLAATTIERVVRVPLHKTEANSGSTFYRITTNDGAGPSFILKCTQPTDLSVGVNHTVAIWQHGILDRPPADIEHTVVACAHDGAGYAILMRDLSDALVPEHQVFSIADHARFLDTMAAMHAAFWDDARLSDTGLGIQKPPYFFTTHQTGAEGWALAEQFLEPNVARIVQTLRHDPQPLYTALARYPSTLVHNDLWWANLGIMRDEQRVVMIDWDFATLAPPAVDLAFYIGENDGYLPESDDEVIETYRDRLAHHLGSRFDEQWWHPQRELSFLGSFLRRGQWLLLSVTWATDEATRTQALDRLRWWSAHVRRGAERL